MKRSTERILTTHTGSLPRPDDLVTMLYAKEKGELQDQAAFEARVRTATAEVVRKQLECGVDVVNDGEVGKIGYSTYVKDRLTGFEGEASPLVAADLLEFRDYGRRVFRDTPIESMRRAACNRPDSYKEKKGFEKEIEDIKGVFVGGEP